MSSTIQRNTWADDTGTPLAPAGDGTLLTNDELQAVYDAIDEMFAGATPFDVLTVGGRLQVDGFGAHAFAAGGFGLNGLTVRNTLAGSANYASLILGNDATAVAGALSVLSSAFTTAGYNVRDATVLLATRSGGLSLAALAGDVRVYSANIERFRVWTSGAISINETTDSGVAGSLRAFMPNGGTHYFYGTGAGALGFSLWNQTAGAANYATLLLGNDASVSAGQLFVTATTFTPAGSSVADGMGLAAARAGGLSLAASHASGDIRFYARGASVEQFKIGAGGLLYERARAIPMAVWQDVPHDPLNFTADSGTWTVQAGDQYAFRYAVIGDMMFVQVVLISTSTAGVGNELRIAVPGGYTAADYNDGVGFAFGTVTELCFVVAKANALSNTISIQRWPASAWGSSTNAQTIRIAIYLKVL